MKIWKISVVTFFVLGALAIDPPVIPPTEEMSPKATPTPPAPSPVTEVQTPSNGDQFPDSVDANKELMKQYLAAHPNELTGFIDYNVQHQAAQAALQQMEKEGSSSDMKALLGITPDANSQKEDEQWSEGMKEVASEIKKGLQSQ